jgi:hypothetical protein
MAIVSIVWYTHYEVFDIDVLAVVVLQAVEGDRTSRVGVPTNEGPG